MSVFDLVKPTRKPRNANGPSITQIISWANAGWPKEQMAEYAKVSVDVILRTCKKHGFKVADLQAYKTGKADVIAHKSARVLEHMTDKKAKDASLRDLATTFNILNSNERLERGLSTVNIDLGKELSDIARQATRPVT